MNIFLPIIMFIVGLGLGLGVGLLIMRWRARDLNQLRESFGNMSREALSQNTEDFLKIAQENLSKHTQANATEMDGKKGLIDQTLKTMKAELDKVQGMVQTIEKDRKAKFDVLSNEISKAANETKQLRETTQTLRSALTNSRVRGQWGERMAEDVLRLAGFIEGINYQKQSNVAGEEGAKSRPDFTFYMPQKRVVHMDVKFPLENYLAMLEADNDHARDKLKAQFLKDVRNRIKEVSSRGYVNQETLEYVLAFIPNEQVYGFINEQDQGLMDEAMSNKVILCSPMTLYAILAVIRQAVDNFHLEQRTGEIQRYIESFKSQWEKFVDAMDKVGKKIDDSQRAFEDLASTRRRMLEKPLNKIEELREAEHLLEHNPQPHIKVVEKK